MSEVEDIKKNMTRTIDVMKNLIDEFIADISEEPIKMDTDRNIGYMWVLSDNFSVDISRKAEQLSEMLEKEMRIRKIPPFD